MSITLTVAPTTLTLPADLQWSDRDDWHPVRQSEERSLTGALVVDAGTMLSGQPVTLKPTDAQSAWMSRTVLDQLKTWAAIPGQEMTLNIHGQSMTVIWRHQSPPALSAEPVAFFSDAGSEDFYLARLNFTKVS